MADEVPAAPVRRLTLDLLATGFPHIPAACGEMLAQASAVCLANQGHARGVVLWVDGGAPETVEIDWSVIVTESVRSFWNDLEVATEHGAYGVAILLIRTLTGYTVIERAKKGTGFDWWLGNEDDLFQAKVRLEVSGILRGTAKQIASRVSLKMGQTRQSDALGLAAYIVVVEFGGPRTKVVQR